MDQRTGVSLEEAQALPPPSPSCSEAETHTCDPRALLPGAAARGWSRAEAAGPLPGGSVLGLHAALLHLSSD